MTVVERFLLNPQIRELSRLVDKFSGLVATPTSRSVAFQFVPGRKSGTFSFKINNMNVDNREANSTERIGNPGRQ